MGLVGTSTASSVVAVLKRVEDLGGVQTIAQVNSNDSITTTKTKLSVNVTVILDVSANSYDVRVTLSQSTTTLDPEFRAVRITSIPV